MQYSLATLALLVATAAAAPAPQVPAAVGRIVPGGVVPPVPEVGSLPLLGDTNSNNGNGSNNNNGGNGSNNPTTTTTTTTDASDNRNTNQNPSAESEQGAAAANSNADSRQSTTAMDCSARNEVLRCCSQEDNLIKNIGDNDSSSTSSSTDLDITKNFSETFLTNILQTFDLDITKTLLSVTKDAPQVPQVPQVTRRMRKRQQTTGSTSTIACTPQNSCNNNQQPQCFDNSVDVNTPIFFNLVKLENPQTASAGQN